jgi:hypothetical protein
MSVSGNGNRPQPFGGTIDGLPVSGVTKVDRSAIEGIGAAAPGTALEDHIFEITGTYDGRRFTLGLCVQLRQPTVATQPPVSPMIEVLGSYGIEPVRASLVPPAPNPSAVNAFTPVQFSGPIGNLRVWGRITVPTKHGKDNTASATFTLK